MGIFSFFSRDEEEDEELLDEEQTTQRTSVQPESAPTGELFTGMHIEVMTKDGDPLLTGRIAELTDDTLTLNRLPGELSFKVSPIGAAMTKS